MHDAKTEFADGIVTITAKRSVRDHAEVGDARRQARMTSNAVHQRLALAYA